MGNEDIKRIVEESKQVEGALDKQTAEGLAELKKMSKRIEALEEMRAFSDAVRFQTAYLNGEWRGW